MSAKERLDDFDREWQRYLIKRQSAPYHYLSSDDRFVGGNVPSKLRVEFMARFDAMVNREIEALHATTRSDLVACALREARDTIAQLECVASPEPEPEPKQFPEWPEGAEEKEA